MPAAYTIQDISNYALGRSFTSSVRLYFLHWMWQRQLGYLLHPDIPAKDGMMVADVGCGTGIWLIDLAKRLPDAILHGYDISSEQYPAKEWLPTNVQLATLDIFKQIPEELRHTYDVVHVSIAVCVVRHDNPYEFFDQISLLLKPGGYIQWEESDFGNLFTRAPNSQVATDNMDTLRHAVLGFMRDLNGNNYQWVRRLGDTFRERNFSVLSHRTLPIPDDIATPWTLQHLMASVEVITALEQSPQGAGDWWEIYDAAAISVMHGVSMRMDMISILGQAPSG